MIGWIGTLVAAPLRTVAVVVDRASKLVDCDCLDIAGWADDTADTIEDDVRRILSEKPE